MKLPGDLHAVFVGVFVFTATQLIRQLGHLYAVNIHISGTYSFLEEIIRIVIGHHCKDKMLLNGDVLIEPDTRTLFNGIFLYLLKQKKKIIPNGP